MSTHHFRLFADYHQFYIQVDEQGKGDLSDAWTKAASDRMLAVAPHVAGIGTVRNMDVDVYVTLCAKRPGIATAEFDQINECSIQIETGRLVIAGCTDYFPDAARIELAPDTYEVLIGYKDLDAISQDGLDGEDSYHLWLFPGQAITPRVLKARNTHSVDGGG